MPVNPKRGDSKAKDSFQCSIYKSLYKKNQKLNKYATLHRAQPKPGVASGTGKEGSGVRTGGCPIWGQRRVEVGCPGDQPRGLELVTSGSSRCGWQGG